MTTTTMRPGLSDQSIKLPVMPPSAPGVCFRIKKAEMTAGRSPENVLTGFDKAAQQWQSIHRYDSRRGSRDGGVPDVQLPPKQECHPEPTGDGGFKAVCEPPRTDK